MRLREMAGSNERALLGGMGRIPDNSYQLDEDTKILQWRWDTSYIVGGWAPTYQRVGWGMWMPIGEASRPRLVRQGCIVEWTVTKGNTQSYRWQGDRLPNGHHRHAAATSGRSAPRAIEDGLPAAYWCAAERGAA